VSDYQRTRKQIWTEILAISVVLFGFFLLAAVPVQACIEAAIWLKNGAWPNFTSRVLLDQSIVSDLTSTEFLGFNSLANRGLDLWASVPISSLGVLWFVFISNVWK
jgi:hypothetical protein